MPISFSPRFHDLLAGRNEFIELDEAAVEIAALEDPELDRAYPVRQLDIWAEELGARLSSPAAGGAEFLSQINTLLFQELKFQGDQEDYHHARNSCLHRVIQRRRGMPITLSLIYLEISRRLLRPVFGIPFPGHFMVRYNDGLLSTYIDPFLSGKLFSAQECQARFQEAFKTRPPGVDPFAPATKRQIVVRIMGNLRNSWMLRNEADRAHELAAWMAGALPPGVPFHAL